MNFKKNKSFNYKVVLFVAIYLLVVQLITRKIQSVKQICQPKKEMRSKSVYPSLSLRPKQSKNRKFHQKTEISQTSYGSTYGGFKKAKLFSNRQFTDGDYMNVTKLMPQKIPKDREELFQENLQLKKQIHRLKDELMKTKGKVESQISKNQKYTKQFNVQFEKKMYWKAGQNSYLISGIKSQYDKLKSQFEAKAEQCESLRKELAETRLPQLKIYSENLQQENKRLLNTIKKLSQGPEQISINEHQKKKKSGSFFNQTNENEKMAKIIEELENKLVIAQEEKDDKVKKAQFLEKLLIEKDNNQYHAIKKAKKFQKEKEDNEQEIFILKKEIQNRTSSFQFKLNKLKKTEQERFSAQKEIFLRNIEEKQKIISKLQKEVRYLSTLLTYWKPLEEIDHEFQAGRISGRKQSMKESNDQLFQDQQVVNQREGTKIVESTEKPNKNEQVMLSENDFKKQTVSKQKRNPKTSDIKHSKSGKKMRRVQYVEIQSIGQYLRYRLIGLNLSLAQMKQYFDDNEALQNSQQERQWKKEYATMQQVKQILLSYPFELKQADSWLLSRYLIEDSTTEHVFYDLKNQQKRTIIKSIMKTVVGDYIIPLEKRKKQIQEQCEKMLQKYKTNLLSALSSLASSGFVSRQKFLDLLKNLNIELSEDGCNYLVSKMLLFSDSLQKLQYKTIL